MAFLDGMRINLMNKGGAVIQDIRNWFRMLPEPKNSYCNQSIGSCLDQEGKKLLNFPAVSQRKIEFGLSFVSKDGNNHPLLQKIKQ